MSQYRVHEIKPEDTSKAPVVDGVYGLEVIGGVIEGLTEPTGTGIVESIVAGTGISVDDTDPANPIVSATGGGGGSSSYALDDITLDPTYGDHFDGSSLDAKWSRVTYASGDETYQAGGGSWLQTAARTTGAYYYQSAPAGDFTLVMKTVWYAVVGNQMFGLIAVDNSGGGVAGGWYNGSDDAPIVAHLNAGISYDGTNVALQSPKNGPRGSVIGFSGLPCWYKLTRVGNTWKTALSMNGQFWSLETATITVSFTPTRIGFGNFQASTTTIPNGCAIDWFDVQ